VRGLKERVRYVHTADGCRLGITELVDPAPPTAPANLPVLLLHGFAQNRLAFTLGALPRALLARGARVFVGELRGHGLSRAVDPNLRRHDWGLEAHLHQDLPALMGHVLAETGAPRLHLMGHSMGGMLGYAALAHEPPLASLTGWAAPLLLGAGRPVVRVAAALVPPLVRAGRPPRVPMDHFLGGLARVLSDPDAGGARRRFQRFVGLSNPHRAAPADLEAILGSADPESSRVFFELARMAGTPRPRLAGVDMIQAVRAWPGRVAAVVGASDLFAGPKSVAPLRAPGQVGLRQVFQVEEGAHVDVTMGHHVEDTVAAVWAFLSADGGPARGA
jgi:pimeloyl-ACP methyl ester carboxylesterase